jgi:hypothetical protein
MDAKNRAKGVKFLISLGYATLIVAGSVAFHLVGQSAWGQDPACNSMQPNPNGMCGTASACGAPPCNGVTVVQAPLYVCGAGTASQYCAQFTLVCTYTCWCLENEAGTACVQGPAKLGANGKPVTSTQQMGGTVTCTEG